MGLARWKLVLAGIDLCLPCLTAPSHAVWKLFPLFALESQQASDPDDAAHDAAGQSQPGHGRLPPRSPDGPSSKLVGCWRGTT